MLASFQQVTALEALVMYTWNTHIDEIFDSTGIDNKENSDSMLDNGSSVASKLKVRVWLLVGKINSIPVEYNNYYVSG